jgi:phage repressor protein C with HTH and peptisase S24 domain
MSLIRVDGDSMEPTLMDGDLVLVDRGRNFVDPAGGIYAITIDDESAVKRLQPIFPSSRMRIISDNPVYPPIEADPDQIRISGKVIWFGRELER